MYTGGMTTVIPSEGNAQSLCGLVPVVVVDLVVPAAYGQYVELRLGDGIAWPILTKQSGR